MFCFISFSQAFEVLGTFLLVVILVMLYPVKCSTTNLYIYIVLQIKEVNRSKTKTTSLDKRQTP